jgi:hypothetical protein
MTTPTFYKLWSQTEGSPVWYGVLGKMTTAEKLEEIIDAYGTYFDSCMYGYRPYFEILKNLDFKIDQTDTKKENAGFTTDKDTIYSQQSKVDFKKVKRHHTNQIKYKETVKDNREFQKEVIVGRRQKLANDSKVWREKHQHILKQKITCACGGCYTPSNKARHLNSVKHQKHINKTD